MITNTVVWRKNDAILLILNFYPRAKDSVNFQVRPLSDTNYVELLTFKIPMFAKNHEQVDDKGLYWEMINMEIRAFTE